MQYGGPASGPVVHARLAEYDARVGHDRVSPTTRPERLGEDQQDEGTELPLVGGRSIVCVRSGG